MVIVKNVKRVAVVMDVSAVGRCALGVALPVLSAMGLQACPLPTMLLSAHTGGFGEVAKLDTSDWLEAALQHYERERIEFDAVYVGYLAADDQVSLCARLIERQRDAFVLVDPAMADHGRLYSGISPTRTDAFRELLPMADLVVPNQTEARLLTGLDDAPPEALLRALLKRGSKAALITGLGDANIYQDPSMDVPLILPFERVPQSYPGTGDLFASVLLGALLRGDAAESAIQTAAAFVRKAVAFTNGLGAPPREGVVFEPLLSALVLAPEIP